MKFFVISVDTESDWFDKHLNKITSIKGIPFLQECCARYDMVPTYLVTYEMATREKAVKTIREYLDRGECEVGHHMHIWSTPPFEEENAYGVEEKWIRGLQSELADDIFSAKMSNLHKAIESNYSVTPSSHRAGRWAVDKRTLKWLASNNYLVDTSISPRVYRTRTKGVKEHIKIDSRSAPNVPYFPDKNDITMEASSKENRINILEVPATGTGKNLFGPFNIRGSGKLLKILHKFGHKTTFPTPFRPSDNLPWKIFEHLVHKLFQSDLPVINFMFHSNELTAGTSPFSKNEDQLSALKKRIEYVLKTAKEYSIKGISLSDVHKRFINGDITLPHGKK